MTGGVLYDDGLVLPDPERITLRRYRFPFGTAKRIWGSDHMVAASMTKR
ncbi:hypothetical protein IU500_04725 [Nocardia terpenica]|nr:hypothetical protein [Nocardia terpenica]MBF6060086.1 hypothetical protein [Nocardia terpenica]MBF6103346.1 hypothetical protein [Nocardia terpenica]MBF6112280.1 hypothetical protein [Nocardia terpenica]MBF6117567.1 hypothetical protein [Nocardia terpenica]MBF6153689.1 hypothetical protein [Nocardia terpenica]